MFRLKIISHHQTSTQLHEYKKGGKFHNCFPRLRPEPLQTETHIFYVLLTVHAGMILVNNQLTHNFFMYVYFYCLHVSGTHVPIIRRITVSMRHLVYITLCVWCAGAYAPAYHLHRVT